MFYFEQKDILGRWKPAVSPKKPTGQDLFGRKREVRGVTRVMAKHYRLPLAELCQIYSADARVIALHSPEKSTPDPQE